MLGIVPSFISECAMKERPPTTTTPPPPILRLRSHISYPCRYYRGKASLDCWRAEEPTPSARITLVMIFLMVASMRGPPSFWMPGGGWGRNRCPGLLMTACGNPSASAGSIVRDACSRVLLWLQPTTGHEKKMLRSS